ncbi:hypothetical protein C8T65DRAFT_632243 [Cerioporus squamosus]|nr:hypothetical protein C8T65DRAFT_632243 [Cerioporus squamosus]
MKPLSAHRPQAPSPVKAKKQTVLPVVRDAALPMPKRPLSASKSVVAKPMSGRRVSAPACAADGQGRAESKGQDVGRGERVRLERLECRL